MTGSWRRCAVVALVAVLLAVLSACGGAPQPQGSQGVKASAPKEIVIGAIYPTTGASAVAGTDITNAIKLAEEIVNGGHKDLNLPLAKNGMDRLGGAKVRVVYADHQADANKGKAEAERLITQEKVVALIGSYNSAVTGAIAPVAERYQIPYLNPESSSPTLTEQGFKWFFRTTPHDGLFAENFFQFLDDLKKQGLLSDPKVAIVNENGLFGQDASTAEKAFAQKYKYQIVDDIAYSSKATDVDAEVQRLKGKNPDVLFHASYGPDSILFMKAYKQLDVNPKLILAQDSGFVDSQFLKNLGADGEYIFSREVWSLDLADKNPTIAKVNDLYKGKFNANMNGTSARAFTGLLVLADAINRAGSTDPAAVQKALREYKLGADQLIMPWQGVQFDDKGQNVLAGGIIVQVQGGKYVTVWPFNIAPAKPKLPVPVWKDRGKAGT